MERRVARAKGKEIGKEMFWLVKKRMSEKYGYLDNIFCEIEQVKELLKRRKI